MLLFSISSLPFSSRRIKGFLSVDIDVSELQVNQCSSPRSKDPLYAASISANKYYDEIFSQIEIFHDSNKCHPRTMMVSLHGWFKAIFCEKKFFFNIETHVFFQCEYRSPFGRNTVWTRGAYHCLCKPGFYSERHPDGFNGTFMEVAYKEYRDNISFYYRDLYRCNRCADGCTSCTTSAPCLASYNWAFRMSLLTISIMCAFFTIALACYLYHHRKVKVFKVASPIFLTITLLGCAIMYLEVNAISGGTKNNFYERKKSNLMCMRSIIPSRWLLFSRF